MPKIIKTDKKGRFNLEDFRDVIDVDNIEYCSYTPNKNGTLIIKFYDKNKKIVKPYKEALKCD